MVFFFLILSIKVGKCWFLGGSPHVIPPGYILVEGLGILPEGNPEVDPGFTREIRSLSWDGNVSPFPQITWRCVGRRKSQLL